jgi:2,4-dienoyl-CoA reductase-like NADH-dependent reductase (Old Yellow Enzyme family)
MNDLPELLLTPARLGSRVAPNRFFAQPMEGNDAEEGGRPSRRTIDRYGALGRGRWGAACVEAISVLPDCLARVNQLVLSEGNLEGFKRLVGAYKAGHPEGLLLFQITHSGRKGSGGTTPTTLTLGGPPGARLLSTEDIAGIRRCFVETALLAEAAGADGVDIKTCHGYFGSEMLRPSNTRTDDWGGSFENRTRFLRESAAEIRAALPRQRFILGSRISMYEGIRGGCGTAASDSLVEELDEMRSLVASMESFGLDYVNVSAGIPGETSELTRPVPQGRWAYLDLIRYAKLAKEAAPGLTVVESALSILKADALSLAADNIGRGYADFAGFGRQSFADPETPAKLMRGEEPRWCIACSGCSRLMTRQVNDGCVVYDDYYRGLATVAQGARA